MRDKAGDPCRAARPVPHAVEILDQLTIPTEEEPGYDLPALAGKGIPFVLLCFQDTSESGDEGELPAFIILRFARFKPEPARLEVDVFPLTSQQFGPEPPPSEV